MPRDTSCPSYQTPLTDSVAPTPRPRPRAGRLGWLSALFVLLFGAGAAAQTPAVCGGQTLTTGLGPGGHAPFAALSVDGRRGDFLIDYAATYSTLNRAMFPGAPSPLNARFDLPSFASGRFQLADYVGLVGPSGARMGVIGTDFLSLLSAHFVYEGEGVAVTVNATPCDPGRVAAAGFAPVSQAGFFSSDLSRLGPGRANVPILRLTLPGDEKRAPLGFWAQIDTGYDDRVYPLSIDVNQALFDELEFRGAPMERVSEITVTTCEGSERRTIHRLGAPLEVIGDDGAVIATLDGAHISLKPRNGCGGIASLPGPAAQLGASVVRTLGEVIFDPKNELVWVKRQ